MGEQTKSPQTEKVKGEQDTHADTDKENRSVDDAEMEKVSGGTSSDPDKYERLESFRQKYPNLPPDSF